MLRTHLVVQIKKRFALGKIRWKQRLAINFVNIVKHNGSLVTAGGNNFKKLSFFYVIWASFFVFGNFIYFSPVHAQAPAVPQTIPSLKTVPVPGPTPQELATYVRDKNAAIQLARLYFGTLRLAAITKRLVLPAISRQVLITG